MYECERLFGISRGLEIQALIEEATGEACPCKRGLSCLMKPQEIIDPPAPSIVTAV